MFEAHKLQDLFKDTEKQHPKNDIKYILSQDVIYNNVAVKKYIGFNDKKEYTKYMNNNINLYERIFKPIRKIGFDLLDHHINLSHDQFNEYIKKLLTILNTELKLSLTHNDIIIFVNNDEPDETKPIKQNINSSHLIIKGYCMDYQQQKELIKYIIDKYKIEGIDEAIYKRGQDYRILHNCKIKPNKETGKYEYLVNYDKNQTFKINEMLINETDKTTELFFKAPEKENEKNEDGTTKPIKEIYEHDMITKNINHLDNRFFNTSADWKQTTRLIKKLNLYNIDEWNKTSVEKSKNPNHTIEKNNDFINNIDTSQVSSGYSTLKLILEKYLSYSIYFIKNPVSDELFNFIDEHYKNVDLSEFKEYIMTEFKTRNKETKKNMYIYKNLIINLQKGTIQDNDNKIRNFKYDNVKPSFDTDFFKNVINDISQLKPYLDDFITSTKGCLFLSSKWGTGKTSQCIKKTIEHFKKNILMLTESNTLNGKLKTDFEAFQFVSHLDKQKNKSINLSNAKNVVCSIQSIKHVEFFETKVLIIDETESVFNAFFSTSTFKKGLKNTVCFDILLNIMIQADKIIFLDADLNKERIKILEDIIQKEKSIKIINTQNNFNDYKINIFNHSKDDIFIKKFYDLTEANKKIIYCSSVNKRTCVIYDSLKAKFPNKNILMVNSNGVTLRTHDENYKDRNDSKEHKNFKLNFLNNLEENIIKLKIDIFLFTPTIKTGVSINSDYFNVCFGHYKYITLIAKESIQQLFRARKLKDKEIYIYLSDNFKKYNEPTNFNQMVKHLTSKTKTINNINSFYSNDNTEAITNNPAFLLMQSLNYSNAINSIDGFGIEFIKILKFHGMTYEYEPENTFKELKKINESLDKIKEEKETERINKIINTPFISYIEYCKIKQKKKQIEQQNDTLQDDDKYLTDTEKEQYEKFQLFTSIYDLSPIFDLFENHPLKDTPQQQEINNNHILNIIDYDNNNNSKFYAKYSHDKIKNLWNLRKIMNRTFKPVEILTGNPDEDNKIIIYKSVNKVLDILNYDTEHKKQILTNKQFEELLLKNNDFINNELHEYITLVKRDTKNEHLQHVDLSNKSDFIKYKTSIKTIYHTIKELLEKIDIEMKYIDTAHTTKDSDKIIIKNKNSLVHYPIKTKFKNKSLDGINKIIKEAKQKTSKNYKLNKKELSYIDSLNDYYGNIDKEQQTTTTKTKHLFKHQLYKKINVYQVNQDKYKFYKPNINKQTTEMKETKNKIDIKYMYHKKMLCYDCGTYTPPPHVFQLRTTKHNTDKLLNEVSQETTHIKTTSPINVLIDTYDNNDPTKKFFYDNHLMKTNDTFVTLNKEEANNKMDDKKPVYLYATHEANNNNGFLFEDDDDDE